jgi:hypothetical protein
MHKLPDLPEAKSDNFYKDKYSKPVIIFPYENDSPVLACWDFNSKGWVKSDLMDGPDADDYDFEHVDTWYDCPEKQKPIMCDHCGKNEASILGLRIASLPAGMSWEDSKDIKDGNICLECLG